MKKKKGNIKLRHQVRIRVRFSEVDSLHIVWHGEYVKYFEDAREAFGRTYEGMGYMDIYQQGYYTPIVDLQLQYKRSLRCDDEAIVEIRYMENPAAKICFEYEIRHAQSHEIIATGSTMQVFTDLKGELELNTPTFYHQWKEKWGAN